MIEPIIIEKNESGVFQILEILFHDQRDTHVVVLCNFIFLLRMAATDNIRVAIRVRPLIKR